MNAIASPTSLRDIGTDLAHRLIGRTVLVEFKGAESVRVLCHILETRRVYGRADLLVTPIGGSGQTWIDSARATLQA